MTLAMSNPIMERERRELGILMLTLARPEARNSLSRAMIAALQTVRAQHPHELIAAAPVGSPDRIAEVRRWCDDVVCLLTPEDFWAIGQFYEDFRQVDSTPRRAYGGTGLGLSICRRLTAMLRGSLKVESRLGHGSTFTLALPTTLKK